MKAEMILTRPQPTQRKLRLDALVHDDATVRLDAARRLWAMIQRLDEQRAHRLFHRFASAEQGSAGWRVAEMARLQLWRLGWYQRVHGLRSLDACPAQLCGDVGLWWANDDGELVCRCLAGAA